MIYFIKYKIKRLFYYIINIINYMNKYKVFYPEKSSGDLFEFEGENPKFEEATLGTESICKDSESFSIVNYDRILQDPEIKLLDKTAKKSEKDVMKYINFIEREGKNFLYSMKENQFDYYVALKAFYFLKDTSEFQIDSGSSKKYWNILQNKFVDLSEIIPTIEVVEKKDEIVVEEEKIELSEEEKIELSEEEKIELSEDAKIELSEEKEEEKGELSDDEEEDKGELSDDEEEDDLEIDYNNFYKNKYEENKLSHNIRNFFFDLILTKLKQSFDSNIFNKFFGSYNFGIYNLQSLLIDLKFSNEMQLESLKERFLKKLTSLNFEDILVDDFKSLIDLLKPEAKQDANFYMENIKGMKYDYIFVYYFLFVLLKLDQDKYFYLNLSRLSVEAKEYESDSESSASDSESSASDLDIGAGFDFDQLSRNSIAQLDLDLKESKKMKDEKQKLIEKSRKEKEDLEQDKINRMTRKLKLYNHLWITLEYLKDFYTEFDDEMVIRIDILANTKNEDSFSIWASKLETKNLMIIKNKKNRDQVLKFLKDPAFLSQLNQNEKDEDKVKEILELIKNGELYQNLRLESSLDSFTKTLIQVYTKYKDTLSKRENEERKKEEIQRLKEERLRLSEEEILRSKQEEADKRGITVEQLKKEAEEKSERRKESLKKELIKDKRRKGGKGKRNKYHSLFDLNGYRSKFWGTGPDSESDEEELDDVNTFYDFVDRERIEEESIVEINNYESKFNITLKKAVNYNKNSKRIKKVILCETKLNEGTKQLEQIGRDYEGDIEFINDSKFIFHTNESKLDSKINTIKYRTVNVNNLFNDTFNSFNVRNEKYENKNIANIFRYSPDIFFERKKVLTKEVGLFKRNIKYENEFLYYDSQVAFIENIKEMIEEIKNNQDEEIQQIIDPTISLKERSKTILFNTLSMSMGKTTIVAAYLPIITHYLNNHNKMLCQKYEVERGLDYKIKNQNYVTLLSLPATDTMMNFSKFYGNLAPTWIITKDGEKFKIKIFDKWSKKIQTEKFKRTKAGYGRNYIKNPLIVDYDNKKSLFENIVEIFNYNGFDDNYQMMDAIEQRKSSGKLHEELINYKRNKQKTNVKYVDGRRVEEFEEGYTEVSRIEEQKYADDFVHPSVIYCDPNTMLEILRNSQLFEIKFNYRFLPVVDEFPATVDCNLDLSKNNLVDTNIRIQEICTKNNKITHRIIMSASLNNEIIDKSLLFKDVTKKYVDEELFTDAFSTLKEYKFNRGMVEITDTSPLFGIISNPSAIDKWTDDIYKCFPPNQLIKIIDKYNERDYITIPADIFKSVQKYLLFIKDLCVKWNTDIPFLESIKNDKNIFPTIVLNNEQFAKLIKQDATLHFTTRDYCNSINTILKIVNFDTKKLLSDYDESIQSNYQKRLSEKISRSKQFKTVKKTTAISELEREIKRIHGFDKEEKEIKKGEKVYEYPTFFGKISIDKIGLEKLMKLEGQFYDKDILLSGINIETDQIKERILAIYNDNIKNIKTKVNIQSINKMYGKNFKPTDNVFIWDDNETIFIGIETLLQAVARAGRGESENKLVNCYIPSNYINLFEYGQEINILQKMYNYMRSKDYKSEDDLQKEGIINIADLSTSEDDIQRQRISNLAKLSTKKTKKELEEERKEAERLAREKEETDRFARETQRIEGLNQKIIDVKAERNEKLRVLNDSKDEVEVRKQEEENQITNQCNRLKNNKHCNSNANCYYHFKNKKCLPKKDVLDNLASISELTRINLQQDKIKIEAQNEYEALECERNHGNKEACESEKVKGKRKCFYYDGNNKCYYAKWIVESNQKQIDSINQKLG